MGRPGILAELKRNGWSLRSLSIANGYRPKSIENALRRPWPRGENIIAAAIGVAAEELWPDRYARRAERRERGAA